MHTLDSLITLYCIKNDILYIKSVKKQFEFHTIDYTNLYYTNIPHYPLSCLPVWKVSQCAWFTGRWPSRAFTNGIWEGIRKVFLNRADQSIQWISNSNSKTMEVSSSRPQNTNKKSHTPPIVVVLLHPPFAVLLRSTFAQPTAAVSRQS